MTWLQQPIQGYAPPSGNSGNQQVDSLLNVLSYGADVWKNLPALKYIMGSISSGDYASITNKESYVPQLGVSLPGPGQMNYTTLADIKQNSPASWELMKSLFAAGNRDLESELASVKKLTPLGPAYESTLIQTR